MNLHSVRLRGFQGFRGLKVDEVFLDFTSLPPEGLIAVCGANGAGKTTLLDNLHPYRLQPFKIRKAKAWSPGAFNQFDQCYGSDACKELVFEVGGVVYRELLLIDAERRKQEAYLYRRDGEHWVPQGASDGKVKTYDDEIEQICGSPALFFTSVFRCQGAKNLSDYTRSSILAIISELLNVDHIKEQSDKCRAVVAGLTTTLSSLREKVSALSTEAGAATELLDAIEHLETELSTNQLGLGAARNDLDALREQIAGVRERIAAQESETARKNLLVSQLTEEEGRKTDARKAVDEALAAVDRQISSLQTSHQGALLNLDTRSSRLEQDAKSDLEAIRGRRSVVVQSYASWLTETNAKIERAAHITSGADKIRERVPLEAALQVRLTADKGRLPGLEQERQAAFVADNKRSGDLRDLRSRLQQAQGAAKDLVGINCARDGAEEWVKPSCRLIAVAVAGRDSVPDLERQISELEGDTSLAEALSRADEALASCRQAITSGEEELVELQKFTKLLPELEAAEANLATWREEVASRSKQHEQELAGFDQELSDREARLEVDRKALSDERSELVRKHGVDLEALSLERRGVEEKWTGDAALFEQRLAGIRQEIEAFPPVPVDLQSELTVALGRESELVASVAGVEKRIREVELAIASQRTKLQAAQAKGGEAKKLQPQVDRCLALITRFSLLQRACSNDGIISLELDDASPSIAAIVNDLLRACYGSRFSIRLDTQAAKADGDMKDVFDIIVFDSETGEEASITEKSGGQTTIIEDAITRGICLYNIHRSDRVYGTLYSDERDGALDADRKLEFLKVKVEALRVGTHSREFFISQTPDLVELADARIMLAPGGARIC